MVCRPSHKKNILFAIKLVQKLNTEKLRFKLHIFGKDDSEYSNKINLYIQKNKLFGNQVVFEEFICDHEKVRIYSGFHLFLVPSFEENFCIAAAEAMHARIPVIATINVNITEFYYGDLLGLIPNNFSYDSWSKILTKLYSDRALLSYLSGLSYELAISKFTWSDYIDSLSKIYSDLIN